MHGKVHVRALPDSWFLILSRSSFCHILQEPWRDETGLRTVSGPRESSINTCWMDGFAQSCHLKDLTLHYLRLRELQGFMGSDFSMETLDLFHNRCSYHLSFSPLFLSISFIMSVTEGKVQVPKKRWGGRGEGMIIVNVWHKISLLFFLFNKDLCITLVFPFFWVIA